MEIPMQQAQIDITEVTANVWHVVISNEGMQISLHIPTKDMLDLHTAFHKALYGAGVTYQVETRKIAKSSSTEKCSW